MALFKNKIAPLAGLVLFQLDIYHKAIVGLPKSVAVKVGQYFFVAQHFARIDVGHKPHAPSGLPFLNVKHVNNYHFRQVF